MSGLVGVLKPCWESVEEMFRVVRLSFQCILSPMSELRGRSSSQSWLGVFRVMGILV